MKKKKVYVLIVSGYFPSKHPRKGEPTYFEYKIKKALGISSVDKNCIPKIHTIRANYSLWKKRIDEINAGLAILSLRYWSGNPYRSKQVEIAWADEKTGIGVQKLTVTDCFYADGNPISESLIAQNDGLSHVDFRYWFKDYDLSKALAIIHFTKFRY